MLTTLQNRMLAHNSYPQFLYQIHLPGCDAYSFPGALEAIWETVDTEFFI